MTYKKAEIRVLGEASAVIQDFTKVGLGSDAIDPTNVHQLQPAYDLDE